VILEYSFKKDSPDWPIRRRMSIFQKKEERRRPALAMARQCGRAAAGCARAAAALRCWCCARFCTEWLIAVREAPLLFDPRALRRGGPLPPYQVQSSRKRFRATVTPGCFRGWLTAPSQKKKRRRRSFWRLHPRDKSEEKRPSSWCLHPRYQSEERHYLWPPVSDQTCFSRSRPLLCAVAAPRSIGREAPGLLAGIFIPDINRKKGTAFGLQ
jgi:hypothetical protein